MGGGRLSARRRRDRSAAPLALALDGRAHRPRTRAALGAAQRTMKVKETWRRFTPGQVKDFLRVGHEGRDHRSRLKTVELLEGMTSVLDVGCGTGVMFELLRE